MTKQGILEHQEGRKNNRKNKTVVKYNTFFSLEFSKSFLMVETKIRILSDIFLNICIRNI